MPTAWLHSPDLTIDDAVITLDAEANVVALNEEAERLALSGDPHGKSLEVSFPIRDEFSGQAPSGLTRSVVLPSRGGELRAFDLVVLPRGRGRGWTIVLRPTVASGDVEYEAWANLSKESKEGIGVGDPMTGTLGLVSDTFAALHGYTPPEMLGMPLSHVFARDGEGVREMETRLLEGAVSWEADHLRKDGTAFPVLMSVTTIRDPLGLPRFRAMRIEDISERRESERRLEAQHLLLERVVATAPSSVYLIDLIAGGVRYLSRDIATTLGYPPEQSPIPNQIENDPRFTLASVHPEDQTRMLAYWHRMENLKEGEIRSIEYRFLDARGLYRWFRSRETLFERDADGRVARVLGVSHDVTEIKEAERSEAFRLGLADALRALDDPNEIPRIACRRLGEHLGVNRVLYAEIVDPCDAVHAHTYSDGVLPLPDVFTVAPYGERTVSTLRSGGTHVVHDAEFDPTLSESARTAFAEIEVRASIGIGLVREGRWVSVFGVHQTSPRDWTDAELVLVRETADRVWAAVERARAELGLRESEARYRALADLSPLGILVLLEGRFVYANAAAGMIFGVADPSELIGREGKGYVAPKDDAKAEVRMRYALAGGLNSPDTYDILRHDGITVTAEFVSGPSEWQGRPAVQVVVRDLTETLRTATALRESEGRLRAMISNLPGGAAFIVDRDLRYLLAEGEALTAAGVRPGDLVGRTIFEALPPDLAAERETYYRQGFAGETFALEHEAHGGVFITRGTPLRNEDGEVETVLAVSYDISERKRHEEILRASERRFRAIFEQANVGIVLTALDGRILLPNPGFCRILGVTEEMARTLTVRQITYPDDYDLDMEQAGRVVAGEIPGYTIEKRYVRQGGEIVWVQLTVTLARTSEGEPAYAMAIVEDIHERKSMELVLREQEARYRTLADLSAEGLLVIQNDRLVYANDAAARLLDVASPAQLIDRHPLDALPLPDGEIARRRVAERLAAEPAREPALTIVYEERSPGGILLQIAINAAAIDWDGRPAISIVVRPIIGTETGHESPAPKTP